MDTQYPSGANEAELGHFVHCSQILVLMPQFPQSFSRKLLLQHYTARAGEDSWHMPAHEQLSSFVVPKTPVQYLSRRREKYLLQRSETAASSLTEFPKQFSPG